MMKTCPNCQKEVSEIAYKCKYCDYRFEASSYPPKETKVQRLIASLPSLFISGLVALATISLIYLVAQAFLSPAKLKDNQALISRAEYGSEWPFKVESGLLFCERQRVLFRVDGKTYAVNGVAMQSNRYDDVFEIWLDSSETGAKKDIGPIINKGLSLCQ